MGAVTQARTLWEEGREPGRQVVALGVAVALTVVIVDLALVGRVSLFFDLCFVVLCIGLVGVFTLLGFTRPDVIAHAQDGVVQSVVSGLSHHSGALVVGYVLCLTTLAVRQRMAGRG